MTPELEKLQNRLITAKNASDKLSILEESGSLSFVQDFSIEEKCVVYQLRAIGQLLITEDTTLWKDLLPTLLQIDHFYREIGGIVGYQVEVLRQLRAVPTKEEIQFHPPKFDDISDETPAVKEAYFAGLDAMPQLSELYPLGGAADRLHLVDQETGEELPAAKLRFAGFSLLEMLIRDLQAREWLYYRLYDVQLTTPVGMMTSREKDNEKHVHSVCEEKEFFGRPRDRFRFFVQPLVPTVDGNGNWHASAPLKPILKPGGHGAIWKLARDEGVFRWMKSLGCRKALVRQINNPIAGIDYGLLAFAGIGCKRDMAFGFASCDRLVKSAEGMVVLVEKKTAVALTNIEYCDFAKYGIEDVPAAPGKPYSRFGSNTNILFVDLDAVEKAVQTHPFPGLLVNLKPTQIAGKEVVMGRLESTMQNIADAFVEPKRELKTSKTFVVHNNRHKTISVAKKAYLPGKSLQETPELCFYELLSTNRELLKKCGFTLPSDCTPDEYMRKGPSTLFLYHNVLGPLYSIIAQKLRGGSMTASSELLLEIAELSLEGLSLDGSLQIRADQILGAKENGILRYSSAIGRCLLRNVTVKNEGIDWGLSGPYWKMDLRRKESVEIILKGCSEFDARDVEFKGPHRFIVDDGIRMVVRQKNGRITIKKEPVPEMPLWTYRRTGMEIFLDPRR